MSSDQNPYEQMFSFVNEVFKNAGMDNSDLSVDEYAKRGPTMPKEAMEFLFGNTFNKLGLDAKTKLFLTLAGILAQGMQSEQVLRQTIRHLREAEVSAENISEAIMLLSLFSGPLVTTKALKITNEISEELKDS